MDRYPMEDISRKISCEMHVPMKNISMKVAVGYVLPSTPRQTWHGREIRAGYARVGVDAIVPGYESLNLDVAGPEEEATLGEYWVVSLFGIRNTSCFQARRQGGHPLLRVLAIHHLPTTTGTTTIP
jgi:hypothetical protein